MPVIYLWQEAGYAWKLSESIQPRIGMNEPPLHEFKLSERGINLQSTLSITDTGKRTIFSF